MLRRSCRWIQPAAPSTTEKIKLYSARSTTSTNTPTYKFKVNGKPAELGSGNLLSALRDAGFAVPSVCFHPDLISSGGRCRICVCDVGPNAASLKRVTPCNMTTESLAENSEIFTESPELDSDRLAAYSLIPSVSTREALSMNLTASLEKAAKLLPPLPVDVISDQFNYAQLPLDKDSSNKNYIVTHPEKCVGCSLCVKACSETQGISAIASMRKHVHFPAASVIDPLDEIESGAGSKSGAAAAAPRGCGKKTLEELTQASGISSFDNVPLALTNCISCGACTVACQFGAIEEVQDWPKVDAILKDETKIKVIQIAPAVRAALAESFGAAPGTRSVTGEMVGALRKIASKNNTTFIYDTSFTADLTIVEEGAELLERLRRNFTNTKKTGAEDKHFQTALPMITSCSPGWVNYCEKQYQPLLPNLSTCKSPQQMHGSITKSYWCQKNGLDPKDVTTISIMPCVAKKFEKDRPEMSRNGIKDVDYVITTREFAKLLKHNSINVLECAPEEFDVTFGIASGAGVIFAVTGGVMEAALRTVYSWVTGRDVPFRDLEMMPCRGMELVRVAEISFKDVLPEYSFLEGVTARVAISHGVGNARKLLDRIIERRELGLPPEFIAVEIMGCPGGCLGGGGQPLPSNMEMKRKRATIIYAEAKNKPLHRSHDNPRIHEIYRDFLGEIGGHKAHELLHTTYSARVDASRQQRLNSPTVKKFTEEILKPHYQRSRRFMTNMFSEAVDKFGCVDADSVVAIADYVRTTPVDVASILSHYHYFRPHETPRTMIYLCDCPTCKLKGTLKVKKWLKDENILAYHMTSWLGWCVNGNGSGPAALIKHIGDPRVHAMLDVQVGDPRLTPNNNASCEPAAMLSSPFEQFENPFPQMTYTPLLSSRFLPASSPPMSILRYTGNTSAAEILARAVARKVAAMSASDVIDVIRASQLRGCGGAGFPSHIKWRAVSKEPVDGTSKYIVVNADEGLPSTFKDYHIMQDEALRLLLFAGIGIAAHATGAKNVILYLRYEYKNLKPLLEESFKNYKSASPEFSWDDRFTLQVVLGGGPYVCGEETALFESTEGHLPQARAQRSIFPTRSGIFGMPTLVNNVETLSWVTQIMLHGEKPFCDAKCTQCVKVEDDCHGIKLLSVCGDVPNPVLGEFPSGVSVRRVLEECGVNVADVAAVEVGGILENLTFNGKDFDDKPITLCGRNNHLPAGGSVVVYNKARFDEKAIYVSKAKFINVESCDLCQACSGGSRAMRGSMATLLHGSVSDATHKRLHDLAVAMEHSSNCGHGKAGGKFFVNMMERARTLAHLQKGPEHDIVTIHDSVAC